MKQISVEKTFLLNNMN